MARMTLNFPASYSYKGVVFRQNETVEVTDDFADELSGSENFTIEFGAEPEADEGEAPAQRKPIRIKKASAAAAVVADAPVAPAAPEAPAAPVVDATEAVKV